MRGMLDRLASVAPLPPPDLPPTSGTVQETIDDLDRILALPRRPPVNCDRDPRTRRYEPSTQALVDVVTGWFSRGRRVSCGCRERRIRLSSDGRVLHIFRTLPADLPPEAPVTTTVAAFVADNQALYEVRIARAVAVLSPGQEIVVPAAVGDGHFCITTLNAVQAWTLREARVVGGILGFVGVGAGKSVSGILAPLVFDDCRLAVILIEPKQRRHYREHYLRLREHFRVPSIVYDGFLDNDPGATVPGTPPLHVVPYSKLSHKTSSKLLEHLSPDVLILDEAHRAVGKSAIGRRVKRYTVSKIREREEAIGRGEAVRARAVRLLDWSGTLEDKSIEDTQFLAAYTLGTGSPLPLDPVEAKRWTQVFDPVRRPDRSSSTAKELQLAFAGEEFDDESIEDLLVEGPERKLREGYQKRRVETLGVISASASSINAAIYFGERKIAKIPPKVREALAGVRDEWKRPDGEVFTEKVEEIACARQVACGFYSYWAFPKHPCSCKSGLVRCDQCLLIDEWYEKRKKFNKELRDQLLLGEANLDSRKLCEEAAERYWQSPPYRGELPKWQSLAWPAWRDVEKRVDYVERVHWIDDYVARDAAEWGLSHRGVVWVDSIALGQKIAEISGLTYHGGGPGGEAKLKAERGERSIIVSMNAFGSGTDGLQYLYSEQLITETPAGNKTVEQLLGRLHREGQRADVVSTEGYFHVPEFRDALRNVTTRAEFNFAMTGNRQKILCADMDLDWL